MYNSAGVTYDTPHIHIRPSFSEGGAKINIKDSGEVTLRVLPRGGGYIVNIYCGEGSQWIS